MEAAILALLDKPGPKQIIFLTVWDLLKARRKNHFGECVRNADLVLPVSRSILRGAAFLGRTPLLRYNPFSTVISILSILETHFKSLYLLGGKKKRLLEAERNIKGTFKNLHILGRFIGHYKKTMEDNVVTAINKAAPSLVLVADRAPDRLCWAYKRRNKLSGGIYLYYPEAIAVFSKAKKHISQEDFDKGMEMWFAIAKNPFKVFLIFPYLRYSLLLLGEKLFGARKTDEKNRKNEKNKNNPENNIEENEDGKEELL
jgi:N-acetylglucosaminyldiphosphoundecaprenol N-acetyl-beta-D-mannosaminyltransferase